MNIFGFRIAVAAFLGDVSVSVLVFSQLFSAAPRPTSCDVATLPTQISVVLKSKFAGWRPKQVSDLDADDQRFWLESPSGKTCPGIAIGHFESTKEISYALLLVPESEAAHGYKVVAFSRGTSESTYNSNLLAHADGDTYSGVVILKADPGKYSDFDGTKTIRAKLDSVIVEWIEKGAVLYYWSSGRYRELRISD
jgi:hypothetical protein